MKNRQSAKWGFNALAILSLFYFLSKWRRIQGWLNMSQNDNQRILENTNRGGGVKLKEPNPNDFSLACGSSKRNLKRRMSAPLITQVAPKDFPMRRTPSKDQFDIEADVMTSSPKQCRGLGGFKQIQIVDGIIYPMQIDEIDELQLPSPLIRPNQSAPCLRRSPSSGDLIERLREANKREGRTRWRDKQHEGRANCAPSPAFMFSSVITGT
jgi:hypothetical protein